MLYSLPVSSVADSSIVSFAIDDVNQGDSILIKSTGGIQNWVVENGKIKIPAGKHTLCIKILKGNLSIDNISFSASLEGTYYLLFKHSGKTLSVKDESMSDGAIIQQSTPSSLSQIQQWHFTPVEEKYYHIDNVKSGKSLDIKSLGEVVQNTYTGSNSQLWSFIKIGEDYMIRNKESDKVLDLANASLVDGAQVIEWVANSSTNQLLTLTDLIPITLNKPTSVSNYFYNQAEYDGNKAVDGNPNTRWATDNVLTAWLEVDLGANYTFNKVISREFEVNRISEYKIQYWDEVSWKDAFIGTEIGRGNKTDMFPAVTGNKVRLNILSVSDAGPTLYEFSGYGVPAPLTGSCSTNNIKWFG